MIWFHEWIDELESKSVVRCLMFNLTLYVFYTCETNTNTNTNTNTCEANDTICWVLIFASAINSNHPDHDDLNHVYIYHASWFTFMFEFYLYHDHYICTYICIYVYLDHYIHIHNRIIVIISILISILIISSVR